jgi:A/G-specific adenine glycosylase
MMQMMASERMRDVRDKIIQWFSDHGRQFPWRTTTDVFHILIAEMLLRRTTATAVAKTYPDVIKQYATPSKLSQANKVVLEELVSPLGLQSVRANHLVTAARILVESYDSQVPSTCEELVSLPGVGRYVASAVLNFGFGMSIPIVDGNVVHLVNRVFGQGFTNAEGSAVGNFVRQLGGPDHNRCLYWGIIDLVAMVCLRRYPHCSKCPLSDSCDFFESVKSGSRGPL